MTVRTVHIKTNTKTTETKTETIIKKVLKDVLKEIKPKATELNQENKLLTEVFERLKVATPSDVEVVLVGSVAKGTQLTKRKEFDVFLLFPKSYTKDDMQKIGLSSAKKAFHDCKKHLSYAEHPYLSVEYKGYDIDVVPAYRISTIEERATAVDRSPFHTTYVNNHLAEKQKDDVRLLKQFMKAQNIYGAEIRVEGFSGYLCELLIVHYGSFINTLRNAARWSIPQVIDIEGYYSRSKADLTKVFDSALIVIDPTDKKRNVAAVVSLTSVSIFIIASRLFLKHPCKDFFFKKRKDLSKHRLLKLIKDRKTKILIIEFDAPNLVEDTLWPQLRKLARALKNRFRDLGFEKFGYYYWTDLKKCVIMFEFSVWRLPSVKKIIGPKITMEEPVESFMLRHKDAMDLHIEHDRIVAIEHRSITTVNQALREFVSSGRAVPRHFVEQFKRYKLLPVKSLVSKRYIAASAEYFTRTIEF